MVVVFRKTGLIVAVRKAGLIATIRKSGMVAAVRKPRLVANVRKSRLITTPRTHRLVIPKPPPMLVTSLGGLILLGIGRRIHGPWHVHIFVERMRQVREIEAPSGFLREEFLPDWCVHVKVEIHIGQKLGHIGVPLRIHPVPGADGRIEIDTHVDLLDIVGLVHEHDKIEFARKPRALGQVLLQGPDGHGIVHVELGTQWTFEHPQRSLYAHHVVHFVCLDDATAGIQRSIQGRLCYAKRAR